jgi:hypothetical protein
MCGFYPRPEVTGVPFQELGPPLTPGRTDQRYATVAGSTR